MKPIKLFGLVALAALAAMAFLGASSATAEPTLLCSEDESPCEAANVVTHVHEETEEGNKATLLSSAGNVECDALFLGEVLEGTFAPLVIHGNFTYTNCVRGGSACTVTEESESSKIEVLKEGHETSSVVGEGEVNVHCGLFINCTYNGEGLQGTGTGPLLASLETTGEVAISEQETNKVSGLCPETGLLDITTMPLEAVYLSTPQMVCIKIKDTTGLYKEAGVEGKCQSMTGEGTRDGNFELGWIFPGTIDEEKMVCAFVGTKNGYFLEYGNGLECKGEHEGRLGSFELGIIS